MLRIIPIAILLALWISCIEKADRVQKPLFYIVPVKTHYSR